MLILCRKEGEEILLGNDIKIKVVEVSKGVVKIGIDAPREVLVLRGELKDRIEIILKNVSLWNEVKDRLKENALELSGGQQQRLCIARALILKPKVLLFDEATSALDNESETKIQEALKEITKGKITITIAHRLSTIEHVDRILFLKKGKIIADGSYKELLKISKEFQKLSGKLDK